MDEVIYRQSGLPLFQNKVYSTLDEALGASVGDVELVQCNRSGLVYNRLFDPSKLNYDEDYQNEQACSGVFRRHLDDVLKLILDHFGATSRGIEIGCGKGYFLDMLSREGANVIGCDPAYQGDNPKIRKEYYSSGGEIAAPDYIVLRHVLEHIPNPWDFLSSLAADSRPGCGIYIEVPCFNWIVEHNAFYDIFYEHCNYFTLEVLTSAFGKVISAGRVFGDQYLYVVADLSSFSKPENFKGQRFQPLELQRSFRKILEACRSGRPLYVWGAGAKGITFANLLFREGIRIESLIDINPAKQGRFIGLSGVPISAPEQVGDAFLNADIIVMNPVYLDEIRRAVSRYNPHILSVA
jgi:hypothetical protein